LPAPRQPSACARTVSGDGGPSFVWEMADADLVGQVTLWAAQAPQAANEIFNVTNGDVSRECHSQGRTWRRSSPRRQRYPEYTSQGWWAHRLPHLLLASPPSPATLQQQDFASARGQGIGTRTIGSDALSDKRAQIDQHADFAFAYGAPAGPGAFCKHLQASQGRLQCCGRHAGCSPRRPRVLKSVGNSSRRQETEGAPAPLMSHALADRARSGECRTSTPTGWVGKEHLFT
jgi:hypothetical protein